MLARSAIPVTKPSPMISLVLRGTLATSLCLLMTRSLAAALVLDSCLSTATITILGVSDSSATSGTVVLRVTPSDSPFETAQVADLNLVLDDGLNFALLGGLVTIRSVGGELELNMVSPGSAGSIIGGEFDQLGNVVATTGTLTQSDPFNFNGGDGTIDLSLLGTPSVNFIDVQFSTSGAISTINLNYSLTVLIDGITVTIEGRVVASGTVTAVPEPGGAALLCVGLVVLVGKRRRRNDFAVSTSIRLAGQRRGTH